MMQVIKGETFQARPGHRKYPFAKMDVNDFFEVPDGYDPLLVANAAHRWGSEHKRKFRMQRNDDGTVRIWRVK